MKPQREQLNHLRVLRSSETEQPIPEKPDTCPHCGATHFVKRRKSSQGHQIFLCRECCRQFTYNKDKVIPINPAAEYPKDVWDIRRLGLKPNVGKYCYSLSFEKITQPWLKAAAKQYVKLVLSTLTYSSASEKLLSIRRFSLFLAKHHPFITSPELDRSIIIPYLGELASTSLSPSTKSNNIGGLRSFLEACYQNEWLEVSRYLIRGEDFPKQPKSKPRYIPEPVMQQLNENLDGLPDPVMRMVLVLQECGMRISELLHLKQDCLLQDKAGDWFLLYYQFKMKKEITIPVSREVVRVIQEQQQFIKHELSHDYEYLFCTNRGGARKHDLSNDTFIASPKPMTRNAFANYLNRLAKNRNILDQSGKVYHFKPHCFRHTVGTRMINSGVPQYVIQRYLGHESPNMTAVYAHIHDATMKKEIASFQGKTVNISGQVVEPIDIEADTLDLQWFKKTVQAQALPNGSCALPIISQGCPHANACLTCTHFRTTSEHLTIHKKELEATKSLVTKAKANRWQRQIEMNQQVQANLENIIKGLEGNDDEA